MPLILVCVAGNPIGLGTRVWLDNANIAYEVECWDRRAFHCPHCAAQCVPLTTPKQRQRGCLKCGEVCWVRVTDAGIHIGSTDDPAER